MQSAVDPSMTRLHWPRVVCFIAILTLVYGGLLFLGRKYGSAGHHASGRHAATEGAAPESGDARSGQTVREREPKRSGNDSRAGDQGHSQDRKHAGDHDRSADRDHSSDHHRSGAPAGVAPSKQLGDSSDTKRSNDSQRSGDRHHPGSVRSFLVVSTLSYLALLFVWAALRRNWAFLVRHTVSAATLWLLVGQYLNARGGFDYNVHSWNRAFADASVVLYAVTLAIGPLARLWRPASHALAWRRETGIWGTLAAAVHVALLWEDHYGWAGWRLFFYPVAHGSGAVADTLIGDRAGGLVPTAFNLANVIGLVALVYALVLTLTSNDAAQRWLKSGWAWLQERATTMQLLVLLHTWLFAYYITAENMLAISTLWACFWAVLLLQTAAFVKTVRLRQRSEIGNRREENARLRT